VRGIVDTRGGRVPLRVRGRSVRWLASVAGYAVGFGVVAAVAAGIWIAMALRGDRPATGSTPAARPATLAASWVRPAVSPDALVARSGVRIVQVSMTGGGGLVDVRFRVVDPDRAASIHDPATPPALVEEPNGLVINQLLMSHAHASSYKPNVTYYLIFENPGNLLHRGARVSVLLGDAQVENVPVG
jgi:hypothetical protein